MCCTNTFSNKIVTFLSTSLAVFSVLLVITKCTGTGYALTTTTTTSTTSTSGRLTTNYGIQLGIQYNPDAISFPTSIQTKSNYQQQQQQQHHHHHHHFENDFQQHNPDFHQFNQPHHHHHHDFHQEKDDEFAMIDGGGSEENSSLIPLEFIQKINNFTEVDDLLLNLVDGDIDQEETAGVFVSSRFGETERSAAIVPKAASCIPELQTVKIVSNDDPSVLYIPSCTRIERCGGCCSHSLLMCQPKESETISYQVVKTQFVGGAKLKFVGKEVVLVEKHTKCKCDCKIQEKDCTPFQEYKKNECRCVCTNLDDEKKCYKENATKLWNTEICACECRSIQQCSTGYMFDTIRCKCVPILVRRRFAEIQGEIEPDTISNGKLEPLPVVPLDEIDNVEN